MRLTCPACRLPIVGTKATRSPLRCQCLTCARTSAMLLTVSRLLKPVLGGGILAAFHGAHVAFHGLQIGAGTLHEIAHEAWLRAARDIENVVQHEDLSVCLRAGTDTDDGHP